MIVGIPTEVKQGEARVATTPDGVHELVAHGHEVFVQEDAGVKSAFSNEDFVAAGATILSTADEVWERSELILKVKEPIQSEYHRIREGQTLFTYLHLAADRPLTERLVASGATAIALETVQLPDGSLPLLAPMSEIAGRMSVQAGAYHLTGDNGGRGVLLGGVPGAPRANVVVIGGGVAGTHAARMAVGLGAQVTICDISLPRLRALDELFEGRVQTLRSNPKLVTDLLKNADLVIGAVLVPGARAPRLVTDEMIAGMPAGAVIVDIAIDQGGCVEHARPTTHAEPTFRVHNTIMYCVANIPGAVPRTSTIALSNATLPYALKLADLGTDAALMADSALLAGVNVAGGEIRNAAVAEAFAQ